MSAEEQLSTFFESQKGLRNFETKDQSERYVKYRAKPSEELIEKLVEFVKEGCKVPLTEAVDVGCGSGQATCLFSKHFDHVTGVDISETQIETAKRNKPSNVDFRVSTAESLPIDSGSAQLMTVFVAVHYFDMEKFVPEVDRVLTSGGVIALSCYEKTQVVYEKDGKTVVIGPERLFELFKDFGKALFPEFMENADKLGRMFEIADFYGPLMKKFPYQEVKSFSVPISQKTRVDDVMELTRSFGVFENYIRTKGEEAGQELLNNYRKLFEEEMDAVGIPRDATFEYNMEYFTIMGRKP